MPRTSHKVQLRFCRHVVEQHPFLENIPPMRDSVPPGTSLSSPSLFVESLTVRFRMDTVDPAATSLDRLTLRVGLQAVSHDHQTRLGGLTPGAGVHTTNFTTSLGRLTPRIGLQGTPQQQQRRQEELCQESS